MGREFAASKGERSESNREREEQFRVAERRRRATRFVGEMGSSRIIRVRFQVREALSFFSFSLQSKAKAKKFTLS